MSIFQQQHVMVPSPTALQCIYTCTKTTDLKWKYFQTKYLVIICIQADKSTNKYIECGMLNNQGVNTDTPVTIDLCLIKQSQWLISVIMNSTYVGWTVTIQEF